LIFYEIFLAFDYYFDLYLHSCNFKFYNLKAHTMSKKEKTKQDERMALKRAKIDLLTILTNTRVDSLTEFEMDLFSILNEDPDINDFMGEGIDEMMEG